MSNKTFFQTPKGANHWFNYILLFFLVELITVFISLPVIFIKSKPNTYLYYFKDLFPSAIMLLSLFWLLKWQHKRSIITLFNAKSIRWQRIFWAMGCFGGIIALIEVANWLYNSGLYNFSFNKAVFFKYTAISVILIPFQATTEELLFRGYYLQGIAWATKRPWVAIVLTSIIFGLLHLANPEIKAYGWPYVIGYILMGMATGFITVMDDGTELAIGMHVVNNLYAAIVVGFPASVLQTNTLFFIKDYNPTYWSIVGVISLLIFVVICYRKYGWESFRTVFEKLEQ